MSPSLAMVAEAVQGQSWVPNAGATPEPLFTQSRPLFLARAPGRLDVMGGIADYSGALVLELPLREATFAVVQAHSGDSIRLASVALGNFSMPDRHAQLSLPQLLEAAASGYEAARQMLTREPASAWAAYVAGALVTLARERGTVPASGLSILVASSLPEARGVSSSAAIEVASLLAFSGLLGVRLEPLELATLAQRIEHVCVGAPCGIMDQVTVALGRKGQLVELLCQPARVRGSLPIPDSVAFYGVDSGVRHQVSGADYTQVRTAAFMGYRMIAAYEGFGVRELPGGRVQVDDPMFGGYLANIPPSLFCERYRQQLPETLVGREFLERFSGTTDDATRVIPEVLYPVRAATGHPVFEHHRTQLFRQLLPHAGSGAVLRSLGELMYQSHASYSTCGLGSTATDRLVASARDAGPSAGIFGAKITGGGSGGTVALLARPSALAEVAQLADGSARAGGTGGSLFAGSSDGACPFGIRKGNWASGRLRFDSVELEISD